MTLATHAVVGGTVAAFFPSHPIIAFFTGFISHFLLDAIPHWDYKILSAYANPDIAMTANAIESGLSEKIIADKYFLLDLLRTGIDVLLGFVIVLIIWHPLFPVRWQILVLGAIGGILPDFLQFIYTRFPHQPMVALQKFHSFMHADLKLKDRPVLGVTTQILTIVIVIVVVKYLTSF